MSTRARCDRDWPLVAAIVVVTFVAFLPALDASFVSWDDNRNLGGNHAYRGLGPEQLRWMWTTTLMGHYIPLSWMTLGLDYVLWGMDARGYHLTNLLLHCAVAALLYFAALRLFRAGAPDLDASELRIPVALAVLLYAVHPLRVESVAWVTERRDMLSMVFYLTSVILYLRHAAAPDERRCYAGALITFVAALLSKATAVTLPAVLLLVNAYPLRRFSLAEPGSREARRVFAELAPFMGLSIAAGILSLAVLHPPRQLHFGQKLAVTAYSLGFYVMKTIVPVNLAALYELPRPFVPSESRYLAGYVVAALALGAAWLGRKRRAAMAIVVATAVIIFPLLGVVQNGPQLAADRYTYHAWAALSLLAAAALIRWPSRRLLAAGAMAILVMGALTWRQAGYWKDSDALWRRVLAVDDASSIGHIALADVRFEEGRYEEALYHYDRAVTLDPGYAEGHNNLGTLLARKGRFAEAIVHYERALQLQPKYPDAHHNWGIALSGMGEADSAIAHFRMALAQQPGLENVHQSWGNALLRAGRLPEAVAQYGEELRAHPRNAQAHLNWGVALATRKDYARAMEHFSAALAIDPSLEEARDYMYQAHRLTSMPP